MKKEISIKNVLIALCLIACSLICAYMGVEAFKKSMYLKLGLNAVPHIICELWVTPNGESPRLIFSNVKNNEFIHPDWHLDTNTSTLKYSPNVDVDLGYLFTMRVVNYTTTSNVFVEVNGAGASYSSIVLAPCSDPSNPDSDSVLISAVSNDYRINFSQVYSVLPTFTQVSFDMSYANNTLLKKNNNYYITKGENLNAKLITPTEACPDVYNLTINSTDKMSKINDGTFYNTLNQTLSINASEINGNIALNSSIYWDGSSATRFASGNGTAETPFQIATPKQLSLLSYVCNSKANQTTYSGYTGTAVGGTFKFKNAYYKQTNDIFLNDEVFPTDGTAPVANANGLNIWPNCVFAGNYNGNFYYIEGVYQSEGEGFFGQSESIHISKVLLRNGYIKNTIMYWLAGLVSYAKQGSAVSYCSIENFTLKQQKSSSGGIGILVGRIYENSIINNCFSYNCNATANTETIISLGCFQFSDGVTPTASNKAVVSNYYSNCYVNYFNRGDSSLYTMTNCYYLEGTVTSGGGGTSITSTTLQSLPTGFSSDDWQCVPGVNNGYPTFVKNRT